MIEPVPATAPRGTIDAIAALDDLRQSILVQLSALVAEGLTVEDRRSLAAMLYDVSADLAYAGLRLFPVAVQSWISRRGAA